MISQHLPCGDDDPDPNNKICLPMRTRSPGIVSLSRSFYLLQHLHSSSRSFRLLLSQRIDGPPFSSYPATVLWGSHRIPALRTLPDTLQHPVSRLTHHQHGNTYWITCTLDGCGHPLHDFSTVIHRSACPEITTVDRRTRM